MSFDCLKPCKVFKAPRSGDPQMLVLVSNTTRRLFLLHFEPTTERYRSVGKHVYLLAFVSWNHGEIGIPVTSILRYGAASGNTRARFSFLQQVHENSLIVFYRHIFGELFSAESIILYCDYSELSDSSLWRYKSYFPPRVRHLIVRCWNWKYDRALATPGP
ncbi:hypothetical protein J6590_068874 [Homalodisca vitripennis]|nr:hypothetical protein J6590_068874 [Homalodisca vitripennis]